ncbi:MAG: AIR synthase related protein, partial [candidate division WOR-3 bacterium]
MRINQLGEQGLIRIIQRQVHSRGNLQLGIGDDALILKDGSTVLTTDTYAEGVHFDLSYMSYYDVGTRCACAALSDVVAMGGEPKVLLVGLAVPTEND